MKSLNDVQLVCTLGTSPVRQPRPKPDPSKPTRLKPNELIVMFPLLWSSGGVTHMLTGSALSPLAEDLLKFVLPGEPLLVTGEFQKVEGAIRMRVRSVERSVTNRPTIEVQGAHGPLFSLEDGYSRVALRGFIARDSVVKGDYFSTALVVRTKNGEGKMQFPLLTDIPVRQNQAVSIGNGQYTRFLNEEEHEGTIFAPGNSLEIGEDISLPANLTTRDPRDRLRLDRLEFTAP